MLIKLGGYYINPNHIDVMQTGLEEGALLVVNCVEIMLDHAQSYALVSWLHRLDGTPGHALVIDLTPDAEVVG